MFYKALIAFSSLIAGPNLSPRMPVRCDSLSRARDDPSKVCSRKICKKTENVLFLSL